MSRTERIVTQVVLIVIGVGLVAVAIRYRDDLTVLVKDTGKDGAEHDATLLVGVFAAGVALVLVGALMHLVKGVKLPGGVAVDFQEWTKDAEAAATAEQGGGKEDADTAKTLLELRFKLEQKLAWVAKHFADPDSPQQPIGFLPVGSFTFDGYLTEEQARTAARILGCDDDQRPAVL